MFTGLVLDFLGDLGKSGSARYSIINSLGNIPVTYMVLIDGKSHAHWGSRTMPGTDVVLGALGGAILLAYFLSRRHGKSSSEEYADVVAAPWLH
jgi:MFS transporter, PAT family, beta-lactamase induction signal transducer AmpG